MINTLLGLVFKSHINSAIGKAVRHIGLLRNSNEETIGMDGNTAEESWRPGNSKCSHLLSLHLAQWSGLFRGSSPSVCSGLGQPDYLLWEPLPWGSRIGQVKRQAEWKKSTLSDMASGRGVQIGKTSPQLILKPENPWSHSTCKTKVKGPAHK